MFSDEEGSRIPADPQVDVNNGRKMDLTGQQFVLSSRGDSSLDHASNQRPHELHAGIVGGAVLPGSALAVEADRTRRIGHDADDLAPEGNQPLLCGRSRNPVVRIAARNQPELAQA